MAVLEVFDVTERVMDEHGVEVRYIPGSLFLFPGLGYGGSCFPKDMQALIHTARSRGYTPRLLDAAEAVNFDQREKFVDMIKNYFHGDLKGKTLAVWGLAFKAGTDDVREAPGLTVISRLVDAGATIKAYDPQAITTARQEMGEIPQVSYAASAYEALKGVDALVINTEWASFREPDFDRIKSQMKQPVIFDGRNLYNPVKVAQLGLQYFFVGKKIEAE